MRLPDITFLNQNESDSGDLLLVPDSRVEAPELFIPAT